MILHKKTTRKSRTTSGFPLRPTIFLVEVHIPLEQCCHFNGLRIFHFDLLQCRIGFQFKAKGEGNTGIEHFPATQIKRVRGVEVDMKKKMGPFVLFTLLYFCILILSDTHTSGEEQKRHHPHRHTTY